MLLRLAFFTLLLLAACTGSDKPATENQAGNPVSSPGATPVAPTPSTDTSGAAR